ncbi:MAG: PD40 domain-containing protein [Magnetococcales bacterium]|nr:PD40 domain-containing protein [Magnetococcales bacterium]
MPMSIQRIAPFSYNPSISADGRFIAFESYDSGIVGGDTNNASDVFVYDRTLNTLNTTSRISVDGYGYQGKESSFIPALSADGRFVAFISYARNLVGNDTNRAADVFIYDTSLKQTKRVSVADGGKQSSGGVSWGGHFSISISADGRSVAFVSSADDLVSGDSNDRNDVFVYDTATGRAKRGSVSAAGAQASRGSSEPSLSADGRWLAFQSFADNLVSGDSNGVWDIFVSDTSSGQIKRVSIASNGAQSNGDSYRPSISADGRLIAFESSADNLVSDDTNGSADVFVYDTATKQTKRISVANDGSQGNSHSYYSAMAANGKFVAFLSYASNLVNDDSNGLGDTFVYDLTTSQTKRVSIAGDGTQGDGSSGPPSISADGKVVTFSSNATNLVAADEGAATGGVFVVTLDAAIPAAPNGLRSGLGNLVGNGVELPIAGYGLDGATVALFDDINKNSKVDAGELLATAVVSEGAWQANVNLAGGTHAIKAVQASVAGNDSKASTSLSIVVATPGGFDLAAEDDSGLSKSDNVTSKSSGLTVSGSAYGAVRVTLLVDGNEYASAAVTKGLWKTDLGLTSGPHAITAVQTSAVGETSEPSIPFLLVVDNEAPATPDNMTVNAAKLADESYVTNRTADLIISGRGEANGSVTLFEGNKSIGSARIPSSGYWQATLAKIGVGNHSLTAKQTDAAGNISPVSEQVLLVSVDTATPAAPSGLKVNGSSASIQTITSGAGLLVTGNGTDGATLLLFNDKDKDGRIDTGEQMTTTAIVGGSWQADVNLSGGSHTIKAIQTTAAGSNKSLASAAIAVIVQTPNDLDLAEEDDSGFIRNDNITNKMNGLTLSGVAPGATQVTLFVDGEASKLAAVTQGLWKTDLSLAPGSYTITASQTNKDGGESDQSAPFMLVIDDQAPAALTGIALTGREPADDYLTNKTTGLFFSGGGGEPDAYVSLFDGKVNLGGGVVDGAGNWSVSVAKISDGRHIVTAKQTDLAGNMSPVSEQALVISVDGTAPAAPSALKFSSATNSISGKGERGAHVILFRDSNANNKFDEASDLFLGDSTVDMAGNWSVSAEGVLSAGTYTNIRSIQEDLAGNISKASSSLSVTIRAAMPVHGMQSYNSLALTGFNGGG